MHEGSYFPYIMASRSHTLYIGVQLSVGMLLSACGAGIAGVYDALAYYIGLEEAGVPVAMHLYARGGHAFGLRHTDLPITDWPQLMDRWLRTIGMVHTAP